MKEILTISAVYCYAISLMKTHSIPVLFAAIGLLISAMKPLHAAEKGGLLVDISKRTIAKGDKISRNGAGTTEVDRTCAIKLDVKNNSTKDVPESPVHFTILIQRWGFSESHNLERYEDDGVLTPLRPSQSTSIRGGEFHIGGHLHGGSERHVDQVAAWKVVITRNGEKVEFTSGSTFEAMNKSAKPAMAKQ